MGRELVSGSPTPPGGGEDQPAPLSYTECFYEHLPYYMAVGMTWDEFWNDDCQKAKYYREAYRIKRKMRNTELWLQGMYIYDALVDVAPIFRTSFDKTAKKAEPYPDKPYPLDSKEREQRGEEEARQKAEVMKARVIGWAMLANKKFKSKEVIANERADGSDRH